MKDLQAGPRWLSVDRLSGVNSMPWNSTYYPVSMKNLPPVLREKAVEIANALLEDGMEEGKAIRIAIAKAKEWARSHYGLYGAIVGRR